MNGPFAWFKWQALFRNWPLLGEGFAKTILLSLLALAMALVLGLLLGMFGASKSPGLRTINRGYVSFIQNTPLVIQVFFLYHGLPHLGLMLPVFSIGVLAISIYHGAYVAEVVRAGIEAVPRGQHEAAYSQGFTYWGTMRHIVLPQARRVMYPALTNQAVSLIKNTSVLAMVAGGELMYQADSWSSTSLAYGPTYVVTGLLYLSLCLPLALYARRLEHRLEVSL
jgi:aspartate/glutamate/glutamine transport system permease protein